MQNSPIRLGAVDLQDFEIPETIRFGGRHRLSIHTLAGGRRIVERLGPDDSEIQFSGTFSGGNAEARARTFDNLRLSGEMIWLTWESYRRQVIIKSFVATYHNPWWISYQISCVVVYQHRSDTSQATSLAAVLFKDLGSALSAAAGSGIGLTSLQAVLAGRNVLSPDTSDQSQALGAVGAVLGIINSQMEQQSAMLVGTPASGSPASIAGTFAARLSSAASLAATVSVRSYIGRIGMNLMQSGV